LFVLAVIIALLPIPVTALGLLPAYSVQARFLVFYAPIVCLLTLGYLFYVRDSLAKLLFADVLNPSPERYQYLYYPASRRGRRLRWTLLTLFPALLLGASFGCFTLYTRLLMESVALATPIPETSPLETALAPRDSALAAAPAQPRGYSQSSRDTTSVTPRIATLDGAPAPETATSPEDVLRTTSIDNIPMFTALSALYIGIFVSAMVAVIVMALKEYAIGALGLSEQALVLGVRSEENEDEGEDDTWSLR
jgi:hypothetical protein